MKYFILILFTSLLFNPCFAQWGHSNHYSKPFSDLHTIPDPNGAIIFSKLNGFYALPAQVEDEQVTLRQDQILFLLKSLGSKTIWENEKGFVVTLNNKKFSGPNGGGGAYRKVAFNQDVIPENTYWQNWQKKGDFKVIETDWGEIYEIPKEKFLKSIMEEQSIEVKQHYKGMVLDDRNVFNVAGYYDDNKIWEIGAPHSLIGNNVWNNEFNRVNMLQQVLQQMEGKKKPIDILNSFEINHHPFTDSSVYVIGPNGGGGA